MRGSAWSEERIIELKRLYHLGLSAGQIAKELGSATRNGVCGKLFRLIEKGLLEARYACGLRAPAREIVMLPPETERTPVALLDLEPEHCRWPISDNADNLLGFCGAPRRDNATSYCGEHFQRAYQKPRIISEARRKHSMRLGKSQVAKGAWV